MELCVVCLLLLLRVDWGEGAPVAITSSKTAFEEEQALAQVYLKRFYTDVGSSNSPMRSLTDNSLSDSLKAMQSFFDLEMTGRLDNNTIEVMKAPRCGVPDIIKFQHFRGKPKWEKRQITYRITRYSRHLSRSEVDDTIAKAFKLFSDVIPLDFTPITSGTADIMMLFQGGAHGDFSPFDGPGYTLAHATAPDSPNVFCHFDEDEHWTLNSQGVNLLLVAAHEIGHALGLDHSKDRGALMFPNYRYIDTRGYKLPDDDKQGVQSLYGVQRGCITGPFPSPYRELAPEPIPVANPQGEQCSQNLMFDAATSMYGDLYFFKNGYYWRKSSLTSEILLTKVQTTWPQITSVDAAYEVPLLAVYLFQGNTYWGINPYHKTILQGYPKALCSLGLPVTVTKLDAAMYEPTTQTTFFFVGGQYWRYNNTRGEMMPGYPLLFEFPDIGSRVDAAFENLGFLYLSHGATQVEYSFSEKRVVRTLPNYGWLNCY